MNIRSAQLSDTGRIAELYQQLFTEMATFQPERGLPSGQDGKIAGFVIAQTKETPVYSCVR